MYILYLKGKYRTDVKGGRGLAFNVNLTTSAIFRHANCGKYFKFLINGLHHLL